MDQRTEMECSRCGKVRILSALEAEEDGWRGSLQGLICPSCDTEVRAMPDILPFQTKEGMVEALRLRRFAEKIVYKYEPKESGGFHERRQED